MAESIAALAVVKAIQIPLQLLTTLHLTGILWPPEPKVENHTCFDYIIVGGGTAGMVVARRLTENNKFNVLVIERGGDPPIEALLAELFVTEPLTPLDWNFTSTYDSYAANSQPGNVTKLTSGRMLGGSSCMNHFVHVRGAPYDFNCWAKIVCDPSWRYENVLPYFKKSEKLKDPVVENSPYGAYHGFDGPMGVARQPSLAANPYLVSFGELGNKVVIDVNGPDTLGFTQSMFTLTDGVRQCSAYSYITPVKDRKNLFVLRHTYATRIIFYKKRAIAVEAYRDNIKYVYRASREIILCTGVYKTPQILMLSGIGPKKHLRSHNIKVIADLPVGNNWQDQFAVSLLHRTDKSLVDPVIPLPNIVPFPVLVGIVTLNKTKSYGDYQVFGIVVGQGTPNLLLACAVVFGYRPEICDNFNNQVLGFNSLYTLLAMLHPDSRGTIRLKSANPFDDPEIKTGLYKKKSDLDRMVKYIKDYMRVGNTTFFTQVNATFVNPDFVECRNYTFGSDNFWRCYSLHSTVSVYHATSSCPMGTVVDGRLRVKKVTNLRIVDASVMPNLPSGNPSAAVIMIAEKASDMIKEDADKFPSCEDLKSCCSKIHLPEYRNSTIDTKNRRPPKSTMTKDFGPPPSTDFPQAYRYHRSIGLPTMRRPVRDRHSRTFLLQ